MSPVTVTHTKTATEKGTVVSARIPVHIMETAKRVAELNGYSNMSEFIKDCILREIEDTAFAMGQVAKRERSKQEPQDSFSEFH